MADLNIERTKRNPVWPWLLGLLVLAVLVWGISQLIRTRPQATAAVVDSAAAAPDSAARADSAAAPSAAEAGVGPAPLSAILPLGPEDVGQRVAASGQIVATITEHGFWLKAADGNLVWVATDQKMKGGPQVNEILGVVKAATPSQVSGWTGAASLSPGRGEAVVSSVYLDATAAARGDDQG